jgi:nucleotide-binding universal stress UspA family protein
MFENVLVPPNGSQLSHCALEPALALSQQTGAEPLLVRVPTADALSFAVSEAKQREHSQEAPVYLETVRKSNEQPRFSLRIQVLDGDVASAMEQGMSLAQSLKAEVTLLRRVPHIVTNVKLDEHELEMSRSETAKVLRSISCSMLVIRPADAELN